jgi:hypothetical protein
LGKVVRIPDYKLSEVTDPKKSVLRRRSLGGPEPKEVLRMAKEQEMKIKESKKLLLRRRREVKSAECRLRATIRKFLRGLA